jgi:hypothetical protein
MSYPVRSNRGAEVITESIVDGLNPPMCEARSPEVGRPLYLLRTSAVCVSVVSVPIGTLSH